MIPVRRNTFSLEKQGFWGAIRIRYNIPLERLPTLCRGGSRAAALSKMEHFVIIVNGWKLLTIITKHFILDVAAALDPPLLCVCGDLFNYKVMFCCLHLICLKVIIFYIHLFPIVCLFNCFEVPNMYQKKLELHQFNLIV